MTEQKAIEVIKYASAFNSDNSPLTKALDVAIKATEKQIAKKPFQPFGTHSYKCSNCWQFVAHEVDDNCDLTSLAEWCPYCGQKLDWSDEECEACSNREIPFQLMTAEEAWELSKKLFAELKNTELDEIFGKDWSYPKLMELSPYEAKTKLEEWESKQIRVGDVVSHQGLKGVVTRVEQGFVQVLTSFGTTPHYDDAVIKRLVKTGKYIDIQSVLDQIGGDESEV